MELNLHNKLFRAVSNTENGEVSSDTIFHYNQQGHVIWAEYSGGEVLKGFLVGVIVKNQLQFSYQHVNDIGVIKTGQCISAPEILPDGRIRLHENWQWTNGDLSHGTSILEEAQ